MSYNRQLSPGGRRIANSARISDSTVDAYHSQRHNSYVSPKSSGERVIPISTQTFLNVAPSSATTRSSAYDSYSGRPRRSSLLDQNRGSGSSRRPNVIQGSDAPRTDSPSRMREYYVVPAASKETKHKRVYSIDDGGAKLVTEPSAAGAESGRHHRSHRRRESEDRDLKEDRSRRGYPVTRKEKSIEDEDAFSYTDPAGMYRDTQPSWRERDIRPRRASLDRNASRERPTSMLEPYRQDPRRSREGPPPSQRGWDKINEGVGRTGSVRESQRDMAQSPARGRGGDDSRSHHSRRASNDRSRPTTIHQDHYDSLDEYDYEPREHGRSTHLGTAKRHDRSVSRRAFGIRSDSKDRHSNESLDGGKKSTREPYADGQRRDYPDAGYREPVRRKHASEVDRDTRHHETRDKYESDADDRRRHHRDDRDRRPHDDEPQRGGISDSTKLAAGGIAGAAALYGLTRDRGRDEVNEPERRPHRDTDDRRQQSDAPYPPERRDDDRGLGFAFEGPTGGASKARKDEAPAAHPERAMERSHEDAPAALMADIPDPDEEYRRRMLQTQRELGLAPAPSNDPDPERERRRREREARLHERQERVNGDASAGAYPQDRSPVRGSFSDDPPESSVASSRPSELRRRPSILDQPMPSEPTAVILDNSMSEKRENRVRIVDPPTEEEDKRPRGILKRPTVKFPEDHNSIREGVAPLKDSTKKGIPPGARWTKIDRRLVNPEALEEAKERYEERLDCVIVLRVLTKEEIQKLADRTKELRDKRFDNEAKGAQRRDRDRDRHDRDEYSDDGLEEWERDEKRPVRMLEAPPGSDHTDRRSDRREREGSYVSSRGGRD